MKIKVMQFYGYKTSRIDNTFKNLKIPGICRRNTRKLPKCPLLQDNSDK